MSKFKYTDEEKRFNQVLLHQEKELQDIETPDMKPVNERIASSESLLQELGYTLPPKGVSGSSDRKMIVTMPSWEELCREAQKSVGNNIPLESLFTQEELKENSAAVRKMNAEYNQIYRLDKYDVGIAVTAGLLAGAVDILLVGMPQKTYDGLKAGPLSDYIRDYFEQRYPPGELENLSISKVPYDAQDNRNTKDYVEGLSAYYHRLLSLGHDPLLGFIFGVSDIKNGKMTTIDKAGKVVSQVMDCYADRKEADIFSALCKQIIHLKSDVTTSMGLPVPLMSLFNFLQVGSIGKEEQTIAEIVQGMYYEGYDFIHFCSMSVPMMIVEAVIRMGYAIKRIKEGHSIKESIPFSTNQEKNPKLATMLFLGHSAATAVNAGKVAFTENPLAINYPQWVAFASYSYRQLKWELIRKPELRDRYVRDLINEELVSIYKDIDETFDSMRNQIIIVS